jgi:sulfite reductase (NADPH) hemoprotein beta-component
MYRYDEFDHKAVEERVHQFSGQVARRLSGELTEDEFKPLRLMNGLYLQLHAYMLRVAIPYGTLSSRQLHMLAHIARKYDKGYAHFTTRQNLQYNWPKLADVPAILADLASVEMHAIQTSGNCIRNVTSDQFAGAAADEVEDPRIWSEIIRQWSTFHPEFSFLPRKFKIAVTASPRDRAAIKVHDIGIVIRRDASGTNVFDVWVGGGQGRTPIIGQLIGEGIAAEDLLAYLEATMRVYNQHGRRDNIYKARIKILVKALGEDEFRARVEREWQDIRSRMAPVDPERLARIKACFPPHPYTALDAAASDNALAGGRAADKAFDRWVARSVLPHRQPGYAIVTISLKPTGIAPGDATDHQMEVVADLADAYSFGEIRVAHEQNLVLADVRQDDLRDLWDRLRPAGLATPNIGLLTDIICCPGGDFCSLANAKSIPVAEAIQRRFDDLDYLHDLGDIELNISGCMNACGHHHVGHIGILGVDKKGAEFYQVLLGGSQGNAASLGTILGPSFAHDDIPGVIATILDIYVTRRDSGESFLEFVRRVGIEPFRESVYAKPARP